MVHRSFPSLDYLTLVRSCWRIPVFLLEACLSRGLPFTVGESADLMAERVVGRPAYGVSLWDDMRGLLLGFDGIDVGGRYDEFLWDVHHHSFNRFGETFAFPAADA